MRRDVDTWLLDAKAKLGVGWQLLASFLGENEENLRHRARGRLPPISSEQRMKIRHLLEQKNAMRDQ